jgi:hypothetical protein
MNPLILFNPSANPKGVVDHKSLMKSATGIFSIPMHFRQLLFSNNFH